jgi:imidazole glycerol phosphate synthase glutamine amidotransferase subunit
MTLSIAVIDYGAGNLRSIRRALEASAAHVEVTSDPLLVREADGVVFPGVGAARAAMDRLHQLDLIEAIGAVVAAERPFLGICLGMQLLVDAQAEGDTRGLGLLRGRVRSLDRGVKVPQIGWNRVRWVQDGVGAEAGAEGDFYFVHSYAPVPDDEAVVAATTDYGGSVVAAVEQGRVWATQFHPEKSGPAGLRLVAGWVDVVRAASDARVERVPA